MLCTTVTYDYAVGLVLSHTIICNLVHVFGVNYNGMMTIVLVLQPVTVFFTVQCYASTVYAMAPCLSVSVCLSQVRVLLKWLNIGTVEHANSAA